MFEDAMLNPVEGSGAVPGNRDDPVVVVPGDRGLGARLATSLAALTSAPVVRLAEADTAEEARARLEPVSTPSALVHVCGDGAARPAGTLEATDREAWDSGCEGILRRAMYQLQAAHAVFSRVGRGRVVIVTSTAGLSGAAGAVPVITALEGARAMAKSAARQWGSDGITVNCVAVPLAQLAPEYDGLTSFLAPPARPAHGTLLDVAAAIEFLTSPGAEGITGATIVVDGGSVMTP